MVEVVVARYNENLDWLGELSCPISIYDKGRVHYLPLNSKQRVEKLGNVGREAHTYIRYILDRYTTLPDVVVFTQGNPRDHTGTNTNAEIRQWVLQVSNEAVANGVSTLGVGTHKVGVNSAFPRFRIFSKELLQFGDEDLGIWYEKCTGTAFPESNARWCIGACFAASRDRILSVPKETWTRLIKTLEYSSAPVTAHYMERSWHTLLGVI
jgi:hypothetical protein